MTPIPQPVRLQDSSMRDGEQFPGIAYNSDDKLQIARALDAVGIDTLSLGFPAVSEEERACIKNILRQGLKAKRVVGLARLDFRDIDYVKECGLPWAGLFASISDFHLQEKVRQTEDQHLDRAVECVRYARSLGLEVNIGLEDGTRAPLRRVLRFFEALEQAGASIITLCDTVGVLLPTATFALYRLLRPRVQCQLGAHFHNDLGLATANSLAAIEGGANQIDVTLLGLGERAGNTPLEELALALKLRYGLDLGLNLQALPGATDLIARLSRVPHVRAHVLRPDLGLLPSR